MPGFFERLSFGIRRDAASCRPFRHKRRGHALTCSSIECLEERVALAGFDVEPNDTWSEASPIGLTVNTPGSVTGSGTLSPVSPVDRIDSYWFTVGIGATVSVTLKVPDSNMFTIYRLESGGRIADSRGNGSELTLNLQYSVTPQTGNPHIKAVTVSTPLDFSDSVSTYELTVTTDGGQSIATDIEAISLERDEPSNNIIFTYNINGDDLPPLSSPFIALYWATGTTFDSIIGNTAALTPTFATTVGTYQRRFSASLFENPPAKASYLLAVVDPPLNSQPHVGAITEVNEENNIIALALPVNTDLIANSLSWNLSQGGVSLSYEISGENLQGDAIISLYWSTGDAFEYVIEEPVYSAPVEPAVGSYTLNVSAQELGVPPDGTRRLLLAIDPPSSGNPQGNVIETDESNNILTLDIFATNNSSTRVPPALADRVDLIAAEYYRLTQRVFVITDGERTPRDFAEILVRTIRNEGKDFVRRLYRSNADLIDEVIVAYDENNTDQTRIQSITEIIAAQVARGRYLSSHLRNNAIDIRSRGQGAVNIVALRQAITIIPRTRLVDETHRRSGPHWHLELG